MTSVVGAVGPLCRTVNARDDEKGAVSWSQGPLEAVLPRVRDVVRMSDGGAISVQCFDGTVLPEVGTDACWPGHKPSHHCS